MTRDKTVRYITAKLNEVAHNALLMRASEIGVHITELAARYIESGLVGDNQGTTWQMRLFKEVYAAKRRDSERAQLEHVAFTALRDGDDDALERLRGLCEDAKVEYEDVIEMASRLTESPGSSNSKMDEAIAFIISVLRLGPAEAKTVKEAGDERGYSEWMMNTAKRRLNVESYQDGGRWWWKLEGGGEQPPAS